MADHTPGPWRYFQHPEGITIVSSAIADGLPDTAEIRTYPVVVDEMLQPSSGHYEANASRICACVNACEGIPTPALEGGVVADLLAAIDAIFPQAAWWDFNTPKLPPNVDMEIRCSRDELLALFTAIRKAKGE